ncbi:hypothetical protein [Actinomadura litoris]|uniref:DUF3558 domain-containing protein n=1 Tax=Actinomadura litoris TaxID=2678616 RepID=A0A7K1L8A3_9ACTN|nr:hypothetical protein [Actinomadura litoris]MUN40395.1 hypothetical protein [Actinomadura litoris]
MRPLLVSACVAVGLFVAGCESGSPKATPSADLGPVADNAPYLCDLVPEKAFRAVTGLTVALNAYWSGVPTKNGLCLAHAKGREAPLGIDWAFDGGDEILGVQRTRWAKAATHPLPAELGSGLAVINPSLGAVPRPNYVISRFSCGKRRPWMSIDFAPVVRGRDAVRDMVDFMRIAERRFGEIHKCTPRPS